MNDSDIRQAHSKRQKRDRKKSEAKHYRCSVKGDDNCLDELGGKKNLQRLKVVWKLRKRKGVILDRAKAQIKTGH